MGSCASEDLAYVDSWYGNDGVLFVGLFGEEVVREKS